jgi:putative peptidoglycan lipid II flippase
MTLARNVATVGTATLMSRLLGFFRDVGIAAVLGAGPLSDAYFLALQIPNLFRRLLAEGALNAAFIPMWIRLRDREGHAATKRFGEEVLGAMIWGLGGIALVGIVFAPVIAHWLAPGFNPNRERYLLAVHFIRLSIPYVAIAGIVAVAASVLNSENRVAAAAFGLVVFNCVLLAAVVLVIAMGAQASARTGAVLSAAVAFAGLGQLALIGPAMLRLPQAPRWPRFRLSPQLRRFFQRAIPGVVAGGIPQLKLMAGAMVASSSQAAVSWLYYANRLYELPLGVVSIAIASVLVPLIAQSVHSGDVRETAQAQSRAFEIALGLALPAAVAFAVLAEPIAGGLFQRGAFGPDDTAAVAAALAAISAGLPGHVLEKVLGAVSFAHEDTRTPMIAALCGLATALAGALLLFPHYGHVGVAAAIAFSGWVGASIMLVVLIRRRWLRVETSVWWRLPGIVLATAAMAAAIGGAQMLFDMLAGPAPAAAARIGGLIVLVAVGLAVYLAATQALGIVRIAALITAARQRL